MPIEPEGEKHDDLTRFIEENERQLDHESLELGTSLRHRLVFWAIRWALAFAVIGLATHYSGKFQWLWPVAAIIAAISLLFLIITNYVVQKKIKRAQRSLQDLAEQDFED
ncbi:hypothetical protein [Sphingorhabdus sp. Alg239-R122]|uniref:hypothetical protein n=1 Tax=Sphingorhabdus sp. Alg239-R122 TaxID=2305989 RepID=UPI0013DC4F6D|nr:hypothetical protein [Sphingorhabdus sp. Alg239-R122]